MLYAVFRFTTFARILAKFLISVWVLETQSLTHKSHQSPSQLLHDKQRGPSVQPVQTLKPPVTALHQHVTCVVWI